jgi:hypothetical protein
VKILILAALSATFLAAGHGDPKVMDAKKQIQAGYDRSNAAFIRKDWDVTFADYAPEFTVDLGGHTRKLSDVRSHTERLLSLASLITAKTVVQDVALAGDTATVTVRQETSADLVDPNSHQAVTLAEQDADVDTWKKVGAKWRLIHSKVVSSRETANGETIPES